MIYIPRQLSSITLKTKSTISVSDVLSQQNRQNFVRIFKSFKQIHPKDGVQNFKNAAVLAPLCIVNKELSLLFTVRAQHLKVNKGQVAFPGGMQDESDRNSQETALRETFEEIGIPTSAIDVWGKGPSIGRDNLIITPFLGYIGEIDLDSLKLNSDEVSSVFSLSLDHLISIDNFRTTQFREKDSSGYKLPVYVGGPVRIWGLTAIITHLILSSLVPALYHQPLKYRSIMASWLPSMKKVKN